MAKKNKIPQILFNFHVWFDRKLCTGFLEIWNKNHYSRGGSMDLANGDNIKGIIIAVHDNYINDKNITVFTQCLCLVLKHRPNVITLFSF